jgi:outer membrane protein OmpA-like peptidoglycan-associated protein
MKKIIISILTGICCMTCIFSTSAQQVNSLYFMENSPIRSYLNPAFQPTGSFYFGLPVLGYTYLSLGNNSLTLKDLVYNKNGETIWFLNPEGDVDKFYKSLRSSTLLNTNEQLNLLNFGFRAGSAYWTFGITEKVEGNLALPKDMFKLLLYGTPDKENNYFNFKDLNADVMAYTEFALGYSKIINDQWTVGGKLKFLAGNAIVTSSNDYFDLNAGIEQWNMKGTGSLNIAVPGEVTIGDKFESMDYTKPEDMQSWLKPSGMGLGFDLGFTYKPLENVTLSASLIDMGTIRWNKNMKKVAYNMDYTFDGLAKIDNLDSVDMDAFLDTLSNAFKNSFTTEEKALAFSTSTSPKFNLGAEYAFANNKLSLGLLSSTMKVKSNMYQELTAAFNMRPSNWFNLSLAYSLLNGRMSNIGAALGIRTGFFYWNLSSDYVSLDNAPLLLSDIDSSLPSTKIPIPYNSKGLNLALTVNFVFGNKVDKDHDGVVDKKDKCPDTPKAARKKVDANGCPLDTDQDSIPDYLDQCPDTPLAARGFVDSKGCLLDTDNDSIPDYLDKCPDTPFGVAVDSLGCPLDTDRDGIPDYLDRCPDTPLEAHEFIDENGCLLDTDQDGVPDYLDLCPNTPLEAINFIDKNGCPMDSDNDGVPDYLDKCSNTPIEARGMVDEKGCPRDTDGDGVYDFKDDCPKIPGDSTNHGCPEVKKEVRTLFQRALKGIQFDTGKDIIKPSSYPILDQIAQVLKENPTYLIEIQGHTDNVGNPQKNMELSEKRAIAVKKYLVSKGVEESRMTAKGYGDTMPVASNKTAAGRALNRRVEFIVTFEEVKFE